MDGNSSAGNSKEAYQSEASHSKAPVTPRQTPVPLVLDGKDKEQEKEKEREKEDNVDQKQPPPSTGEVKTLAQTMKVTFNSAQNKASKSG